MIVSELISKLEGFPKEAEVVLVHSEWQIKKVELNEKNNQVEIK